MIRPASLIRDDEDRLPTIQANANNIRTESIDCGIRACNCCNGPGCQRLGTSTSFLIILSLTGFVQGGVESYFRVAAFQAAIELDWDPVIVDWLLVSAGISMGVFALIIAYWGNRIHRISWLGGIFMIQAVGLLMLIIPTLTHNSSESDTIGALQVDNVCELQQSAEMQDEKMHAITTLVLLFVGQALIGMANIVFYCLGMSYLDDNLREHQSPSHIGCALGARIWGQQFGLAIVLAVGATPLGWWLGWVIIGPIVFVLGFLLALFPKRLLSTLVRQAADDIIETATNNSTQSLAGHKWLADIGLAASLKRIFTNGILIFNILALVFVQTGMINFNAHEQNYLQSRFFLPTSHVNGLNDEWTSRLITNLLRPPVVALAVILAGLIIAKANPSPRKLAAWNVFVGLVAVGLFIAFIFISCDNEQIAGARKSRLTKTYCAHDCVCPDNVPFSPVCPEEGIFTYFSPCHAGCQNRTEINNVIIYENCSCGAATDLFLKEGVRATEGACGMADCQKYWIIFQVLTVVVSGLLASAIVGKFIISVRAVLPQDKSLALAMELTLVGLVAYLPGTAAYQMIAFEFCQLWSTDERRCFIHETPIFGNIINILTAVLIAVGVVFEILVFYFVKDLPLYGDDPDDAYRPIEMRLISQQVRNSSRQTTFPAEPELQPFSNVDDEQLQLQQPDFEAQSNSLIRQASTVLAHDPPHIIDSIQNTQDTYPRNARSVSPIAGPSFPANAAVYAEVIRQLPTRAASSDLDESLDFRSTSSLPRDKTDDDDDDTDDFEDSKMGNGPLTNLRDYSGMNPALVGSTSSKVLDSPQSSVVSSPAGFRYPSSKTQDRNGRPLSPETDF
ncbi:solute carrier organic anion transporter family member 1C1 [Uranotaenia lowii]|uniref:solute carrier organic anion transporter family member 1C1 n=1 Tax=Uranotaenia lowii TaxID=190385 RepID=UPI00247A1782|nr:solute carrier organic anion transporter family member 1C1 [Uranotaenia lowii]